MYKTVETTAQDTICKVNDTERQARVLALDRSLKKYEKLCTKFGYEYSVTYEEGLATLKDMRVTGYEALLVEGIKDAGTDKEERRETVKAVISDLEKKGLTTADLFEPIRKRCQEAIRGR